MGTDEDGARTGIFNREPREIREQSQSHFLQKQTKITKVKRREPEVRSQKLEFSPDGFAPTLDLGLGTLDISPRWQGGRCRAAPIPPKARAKSQKPMFAG
jgi:hypothetical protein